MRLAEDPDFQSDTGGALSRGRAEADSPRSRPRGSAARGSTKRMSPSVNSTQLAMPRMHTNQPDVPPAPLGGRAGRKFSWPPRAWLACAPALAGRQLPVARARGGRAPACAAAPRPGSRLRSWRLSPRVQLGLRGLALFCRVPRVIVDPDLFRPPIHENFSGHHISSIPKRKSRPV